MIKKIKYFQFKIIIDTLYSWIIILATYKMFNLHDITTKNENQS